MGYLTDQSALWALSLSLVSATQLASRNPAAVKVRRQPAGHPGQEQCGQRTGVRLLPVPELGKGARFAQFLNGNHARLEHPEVLSEAEGSR